MAANQIGKSWAGCAESAIHLTGRYPDWWRGAEFKKPTKGWVAGNTGLSTRDVIQKMLVGPPQIQTKWGTAAIPGDAIIETIRSRGVADALDSVVVRHGGGGDVQAGESICMFKAYEQGREKWQGDTIDFWWGDEEMPEDIYSEGRVRTQKGQLGVFLFITFTPLLGMSKVVRRFIADDDVDGMSQ